MRGSFERRKAAYQAFVEKQAGRSVASGLTVTYFEERNAAYQAFVEILGRSRLSVPDSLHTILLRGEI